MAHAVIMPKLIDQMLEGHISEWQCSKGQTLFIGQPLFTVKTDKAITKVPIEKAGILLKLLVEAGLTVPIGAPVAWIGLRDELIPITNVKGDRRLRPNQQADLDMFLRVVKHRSNRIEVRGAKAHQTGAVFCHEIIVIQSLSMCAEDKDYAVAFALPIDCDGIIHILGQQSCDSRKLEDSPIDLGNATFGGHEALVIFDDVFVPKERIFMDGEWQFARILIERFVGYHRRSYGGCKAGLGDVLIGAAAEAAENAGVANASHVKRKLNEMIHLNETIYSCDLGCSAAGSVTPSGIFLVALLLTNVCLQNVTRIPYEIARLAEDLAGGLIDTMPSEKDLNHPKIGPLVEKYLHGVAEFPTADRKRIIRLIKNLTMGTGDVSYLTESLHGA